MADQQTGGDGSVSWSVTADEVDPIFVVNNHMGPGKGRHFQSGKDESGKVGGWFTVSIRAPEGMSVADYLDALKSGKGDLAIRPGSGPNRVQFKVKIEAYTPDQIRVSWGDRRHRRKKVPKRARAKR